jgi:hypothetical protein
MEKEKLIRLSLDLTPEMYEVVNKLAIDAGTNKSDVLRRAIGLYKVSKEGEKEGKFTALVKEGKIDTRLVGI